jgi:phage terminase Nu1 subunit (DNA packaging protein)
MAGTETNVTGKVLAHIFGVTERYIQILAADGVIFKEGRGRYRFIDSLISYIAFLKADREGTQVGETAYGDARTQKMRADADKAIMEAATLAGDLIPVDIVAYSWNHMTGAFRAKLLNLPKKTAPVVQHENSFRKCQSALQSAVHDCLAELSEYKPPEKHFGNLEQFLHGTTARLEDKPVGGTKSKTVKRKQRRAG